MVVLMIAMALEFLGSVPAEGWLASMQAVDVAELAVVPLLLPAMVARPGPSVGCATVSIRRFGYMFGALLVVSMAMRKRSHPKEPLTDEQREKFRNL